MNIRLDKLTLRNFKGTAFLEAVFNGKDATVYGDNSTGKTTLDDAFTWVLFDKNSLGASDFEIKPIGMERPVVEVVCELRVDERAIVLKKRLEEKWDDKRSDGKQVLTGHTTSYWINDREIEKKSEYKAFIDGIVAEDTFKMLTNGNFFLSKKKEEMRKILWNMPEKVKDEDIAGDDKEQIALVSFMQGKGYSVEDVLKLTKQNITTYECEQTKSKAGIEENSIAQSGLESVDYEDIEKKIAIGRAYIEKVENVLYSAQEKNKDITTKQKSIFELQEKAEKYKQEQIRVLNEDRDRNIEIRNKLSTHSISLKGTIDNLNQKIYNINDGLKQVAENQGLLVAQFKQYSALQKENAEKVFEPIQEDAMSCDKCGQKLPAEQIEQMNTDALALFDTKKQETAGKCKEKIADITTKGQLEKARKTNLELQLADLAAQKEKINAELQIAESQLNIVSSNIENTLPAHDINLDGNPEYDAIMDEIARIRDSLSIDSDNTPKLIENKRKVQEQIDELNIQLSKKGESERLTKRIEELSARGKELAGLIAQEKAMQYQAERFNRAKSERLEGSINALFENLSFRLFETQLNGNIVDDCTPVINGVEYRNASNSDRIRANLDIINAMQKSADTYCVTFIDNAEACTHYRDMKCQMIYLFVSEQDKKLRINLLEDK